MPIGSFALVLSLPLVWAGFADAVWRRRGLSRTGVLVALSLILAAHAALGRFPAVNGMLAALPAAVSLAFPPAVRLRQLGFLAGLLLLAALGSLELGSLALMGLDGQVGAVLTLGVLAGVLSVDAPSASALGFLGGFLALMLPAGDFQASADPFQLVWGSGLVGGWAGLLVERGVRVRRREARP